MIVSLGIMGLIIYHITLIVTGVINILMAAFMLRNNHKYKKHKIYLRTRCLTVVWLAAFGIGYLIHAFFHWRVQWPTAASALTATYFHLGAICFSWGYTSLLNPNYLTKRITVRDLTIYAFSLLFYWTVAFTHVHAPLPTLLSYGTFFAYAVYITNTFYSTYNRASYRLLHMPTGNWIAFVRWMQVCCDLIVLFGLSSVALTAVFPVEIWPYSLLLIAGVGMFGYIVYSLDHYGTIIDEANVVLRI